MFEDTNPRDLKELIGQIHNADSALPEFQRDFVWDPSATRELIVSVAKGFPAGSILRIRNNSSNSLFASREFQGASPLNSHLPIYLVLDGQQRLTSLYQAFYGVGDYRYFIDLKKLLAEEEFEECIFSLKENRPQARRYNAIATQAEELILPLSVLKNDAIGGFSQWILEVSRFRHSDDANALIALQQELQEKIQNRWIQTVNSYQFPVVTLLGDTEADAVCIIFETLNRTGVKLTAFDLLTARFWPQQINLRREWDDAKDKYPILNEMDIDPYYLLQAMSLCVRPTPGCKRGEVLDLKRDEFREWWDKIVANYAYALEILHDECGVIAPKWLPYSTIPIPMAATLAKTDSASGPSSGNYRQRFVRWYWCSVLQRTYDNPPNSQAAKDFNELVHWFSGGNPPESVTKFRIGDIDDLREVTFRQRALYRGLMGLVLRNRPRDFHKGEQITGAVLRGKNIDDHHIFPEAWLRENGHPTAIRDCILNRTMIDSETNKKIGKRAPSDYISEVGESLDSNVHLNDLLDSHFCAIDELQSNKFEDFLAERETRFRNAIREVTS